MKDVLEDESQRSRPKYLPSPLRGDLGCDDSDIHALGSSAYPGWYRRRGFFRKVQDAQGVTRTIEGAPYKLSRTPGGPSRGAPEFGSDQTYVLREVLGLPDDELAGYAIAGIFE